MCFFLGGGLGILGVVYKDYIYIFRGTYFWPVGPGATRGSVQIVLTRSWRQIDLTILGSRAWRSVRASRMRSISYEGLLQLGIFFRTSLSSWRMSFCILIKCMVRQYI